MSSRWELMTRQTSDGKFLQVSTSKESCGSNTIYSFGFCTGQHILLAHPACMGPGGGKQSASLSLFSEPEGIFFCFSIQFPLIKPPPSWPWPSQPGQEESGLTDAYGIHGHGRPVAGRPRVSAQSSIAPLSRSCCY